MKRRGTRSESARAARRSTRSPGGRHAFPPERGGASIDEISPPFASTVLLVDGDFETLETLRLALGREPFETVVASSAREALNILARSYIDVVVTDDHLPGMSGSKFLGVVKRRHPRIARIVLTGALSLDTAARAISEAGAHAFLTRPCDPETLAGVINEVLRSGAGTPTTPLGNAVCTHHQPAEKEGLDSKSVPSSSEPSG